METKRFETDKVIRVGVPVETWVAGDLLFFAMALGRKVPRLIGAPIVTHRLNCGKRREL